MKECISNVSVSIFRHVDELINTFIAGLTPSLPGGFTCKSYIFTPLYNYITHHSIVLEQGS